MSIFPILIFSVIIFLVSAYTLYHWFPKVAVEIYNENSWKTAQEKGEAAAIDTGLIGDTFGGTLGPLVALIAALITGLAFWVQYEANQQQKKDLQIERFESKFYSLLQLHRDNITELTIGKTTQGRKAFISMFNELKFTHYLVEEFYKNNYVINIPHDPKTEDVRYNISYLIFFFGVGPNSSPIVIDLIGKQNLGFFLSVEEWVKLHQVAWSHLRALGLSIGVNTGNGVFDLDIKYKPCNGHVSKLSHYVRNLYQLVKFVDDADETLISQEQKYNYATTIRSQLSVHEQLLLFYNAVSVLGKPWLDGEKLMRKYCIVKSTPLTIADFHKRPIDVLGTQNADGKPMFEWNEIRDRINQL
jgi:hypothetical protein